MRDLRWVCLREPQLPAKLAQQDVQGDLAALSGGSTATGTPPCLGIGGLGEMPRCSTSRKRPGFTARRVKQVLQACAHVIVTYEAGIALACTAEEAAQT